MTDVLLSYTTYTSLFAKDIYDFLHVQNTKLKKYPKTLCISWARFGFCPFSNARGYCMYAHPIECCGKASASACILYLLGRCDRTQSHGKYVHPEGLECSCGSC